MLRGIQNYLRRRQMKTAKPFGKNIPAQTLRLSLCDRNPEMVDAWIDTFHDVPAVEILEGSLLDLDCNALVSPANSFGDMSGGIDKAIDDFYHGAAQNAVMSAIRDRYLGELPVGMALIVSLPSKRLPFLVAAPTMRVPSTVADTINAYLSLRAALVAVLRHNQETQTPIRSLAVSGLCTGVGGMDYGVAAQQMRSAYDTIIGGRWQSIVHPAMAPYAFGANRRQGWGWKKSPE